MATAQSSIDSNFGGYVNWGNASLLGGATNATWAFWINRISNTGAFEHYLSKWIPNTFVIYNFGSSTGLELCIATDAGANITCWRSTSSTVTLLPLGEWHHVAITYDGSGGAGGGLLYIDGVLTAFTRYTGTATSINNTTNTANYVVGTRSDIALPSDAYYNDVQVFNQTLTVSQIKEIMSNPWSAMGYGCISWESMRQATSGIDMVSKRSLTYTSTLVGNTSGKVANLFAGIQ